MDGILIVKSLMLSQERLIDDMKYTFEGRMARLEEISGILSENTVSLDDSLKLYEEGVKLLKFCNEKLNSANLKIKTIEEDL